MRRARRAAIAGTAGAVAVALLLAASGSRETYTERPADATLVEAAPASRETRPRQGSEPRGAALGGAARPPNDVLHRARVSGAGDVRLDAIAELGDNRRADATVVLVSLLDDPQVAAREQAVESLGAIGGDAAVAGLAYALSDGSKSVRHLAIEALSEIAADSAVGALALTLDDPDVEVREHAVEALTDLDSEAAASVLQRFAADPQARVRRLAADSF